MTHGTSSNDKFRVPAYSTKSRRWIGLLCAHDCKTGGRKGERAWGAVAEAARDAQHTDSQYALGERL